MSDSASGARRLGRLTLRTCVRGLVIAVFSVVPGIPLFVVSMLSLPLLCVGIGVVPVPMSLLAVRRRASQQRSFALEWSGVSIATPYRPRPHEVSNGLIGRLQRCKWLLTDPATWRDLLWILVNVPVGVALGEGRSRSYRPASWTAHPASGPDGSAGRGGHRAGVVTVRGRPGLRSQRFRNEIIAAVLHRRTCWDERGVNHTSTALGHAGRIRAGLVPAAESGRPAGLRGSGWPSWPQRPSSAGPDPPGVTRPVS